MARQAESFRGRCGTWSWPRTCGWAGRSWGSSGLALLSHQCQGSAEAASPTLVYASLGPSRAPIRARPTLATTNAGRLAPVCPLCHGECPWFATAATAWVTALVAACCQATRGCASTSPCRGGRRGSGCYCYGRNNSGTASYGAGKRAKESAGDVVPPRSGHVRASIASTTWPGAAWRRWGSLRMRASGPAIPAACGVGTRGCPDTAPVVVVPARIQPCQHRGVVDLQQGWLAWAGPWAMNC